MILVSVQYIIKVIPSLYLVTDDAPFQLDVILSIYKNLQIQ